MGGFPESKDLFEQMRLAAKGADSQEQRAEYASMRATQMRPYTLDDTAKDIGQAVESGKIAAPLPISE